MAKPTRINFYQGKICIKKPDDSLIFQDDSKIPLLKSKIDEYIENNPNVFSTRIIIFESLTALFGISKFFVPPGCNNYVPYSEPLYNELIHYISNNQLYFSRLCCKVKAHTINKENKSQKIRKHIQIAEYEKEKRVYFAKQKMYNKKR